jgi:flagellar biogenesis protein FliO
VSLATTELPLLARSVLALAAVLALMGAARWLLLRRGVGVAMAGGRADAGLVVAASLALDARNRLVVVRHGDAEFVLAVGPQGVSRLDLTPAGRPASPGDRPAPP